MPSAEGNAGGGAFSTSGDRQWIGVGLVAGVTAIGTAWYWLVEDFSFLNALYQAVITVSTVGFGETEALDTSGRIFSIGLIIVGVAAMVYALGAFAGMLIESSVERMSSRRKERSLERLNDHVMICGYGRIGGEVARLLPPQRQLAVIDADPDRASAAANDGYIAIEADCTLDETLIDAGIKRAKRLIVCLGRDGDAISTVLSARTLNPELLIVSRVNTGGTRAKLRMAGADHVVSPIEMAAQRLVGDTFDPSVGAFFDAALHDQTIPLSIRGAACRERITQAEVFDIEAQSGARVLGVHTPEGAVAVGLNVEAGHLLIAAGHEDELNTFAQLVSGRTE